MNMNDASGVDRINLKFVKIVNKKFAFLCDLGFVEVESLPTFVLYRNGDIDVDVYHGRQSYEIGFGITHHGVRYSLSELIRFSEPEFAEKYRYPTAMTQEALADGLTKVTELAKRHCIKALQGEQEFFTALDRQRKLWAEKYAFSVMVEQLRPKAHEAFRLGKYQEAAELYRKIEFALSPADRKKLAFAEDRRKE